MNSTIAAMETAILIVMHSRMYARTNHTCTTFSLWTKMFYGMLQKKRCTFLPVYCNDMFGLPGTQQGEEHAVYNVRLLARDRCSILPQ